MEVGLFEPARGSHFSSFPGLKSSRLSKVKLVFQPKYSGLRSYRCSGAAVEISGSIPLDWKPALDEIVLMSSILLAYVAGIVNKPFNSFTELRRPAPNTKPVAENREQSSDRSIECIWDCIDEKLTSAATTMEFAAESSPALYLQALDYGPRIRLLLEASKSLRNESTRQQSSSPMTTNELCSMAGKICRHWVSEESRTTISVPAGFLTTNMANLEIESLSSFMENEAEEYTRKCLERSGKIELYTEFLMFLTRASTRPGDAKLAQNILEDMVIVLSEGAAAMYLNAVAGMKSGWSPLLHPSISSTRALERFRNKVALQQWIHHNFDSVAAIYEDRVELWVMNKINTSNNKNKPQERRNEEQLQLSRFNFRLRRSRELRELSGWRCFYSLYLEFYDIVGPLVRVMISKVGQGLSFLLVCLIGRSFGLIYQGIRQSVKWSSSSD